MSLWESYADKIVELIPDANNIDEGVVILLQFGHKTVYYSKSYMSIFLKIRYTILLTQQQYSDELRVGTTAHATRLLINEDIPEFHDFNMKYTLKYLVSKN